MSTIRPAVTLLDQNTVTDVIRQAWEILEVTGVKIDHGDTFAMLADSGMPVIKEKRIGFPRHKCEPLLATVPAAFQLFERDMETQIHIGGDSVHYDPGSAAVYWLDPGADDHRRAMSADCMLLARLTEKLDGYHIQSTGVVPSDVPEEFADCLRLIYPLVFCRKPVITGTFRKSSFDVMHRMLSVIAGSPDSLRSRPIAVFDCCPSPPLKWSDLTGAALLDCARAGIPVEMVSMPLAGATAPVTLIGSVIQHTAESLSGAVIHQTAAPGAPIIWGGSPAAFDMRHGTPPMGAMETMMIDMAYSQVGKHLGFPTHAYMACSDAKLPDYQAGMESGIGAVLAALAGINIVSGPGFLNYENTHSPEKIIQDHDACCLAYRLIRGLAQDRDLDIPDLLHRHADKGEFLADPSTRKYHRRELSGAGKTVFRGSMDQWRNQGKPLSRDLAQGALKTLTEQESPGLDSQRTQALADILLHEADKSGIEKPVRDILKSTGILH